MQCPVTKLDLPPKITAVDENGGLTYAEPDPLVHSQDGKLYTVMDSSKVGGASYACTECIKASGAGTDSELTNSPTTPRQ